MISNPKIKCIKAIGGYIFKVVLTGDCIYFNKYFKKISISFI